MNAAMRSRAVLATSFATAATVAAYPILAPLVEVALAGGATGEEWLSAFLRCAELSAWPAFWVSGTWVAHLPCMLAALAVSSIVLFAYSESTARRGERAVDGGIYGEARVTKTEDELTAKNDFWDGCGTPSSAGLVLGATERGYWYDSGVPHCLVVGKSGSGKSQLMVLESLHLLMAAGWNLLVTGKSELIELTADKARELGRRVVVFDLSGYPGASRYNPLALVREYVVVDRMEEAVKCARQVATDLVPIGGEKNTYFPKAARNLITALILVVCTEAAVPDEARNLSSVAAILDRGTVGEGKDPSEPLKAYIRGLGESHPAFAPASDFLSDGGKTTAGKNVLSTAKEALSIFSDEGMRRTTSASDVLMRELFEQPSATYMTLLEPGDPYLAVNKCFMSQWWRVAQEVAREHGGRVPHETAIVGDELGNVGRIDALPQIATLGRSFKVHLYAFVQNLGQMNDYNAPGDNGAGREKVLGSIGTKVALALAEPNDCEWFTKLAGKRTVRSRGTSAQRSGGRATSGESYSEAAVNLIEPWVWTNLIPIRDGATVIKGGENSRPGREGVFRFPLAYASRTPAGAFFGLGTEEEESAKKAAYYARVLAEAEEQPPASAPWCPDLPSGGGKAGKVGAKAAVAAPDPAPDPVSRDEWAAWDEGMGGGQ